MYKIGSTIDHKQRMKALQREGYAGFDDWAIICVCRVKNSGKVEFEIHKKLGAFKVHSSYENAGVATTAKEAFKTDLITVWQAYQTTVDWRNLPNKSKKRVEKFERFNFKH